MLVNGVANGDRALVFSVKVSLGPVEMLSAVICPLVESSAEAITETSGWVSVGTMVSCALASTFATTVSFTVVMEASASAAPGSACD